MSEESGSSDRRDQIDALAEPVLRQLLVEVRDFIVRREHGSAAVAKERARYADWLPSFLGIISEKLDLRDVIEDANRDVSDEDFARLVERASEDWQYSDALVREYREAVATGVRMGKPGKGRPAARKREAVSKRRGWWPFGTSRNVIPRAVLVGMLREADRGR